MISLQRQFQSVVLSIVFGMFFMFMFLNHHRIFRNKNIILRLFFKLPLFISLTYLYFYLNALVNDGLLNIYIPLFIILGMWIYHKFYSKYILKYLDKLIAFINIFIINKLKLEFKKLYGIIKVRKKVRKDAKKQQSRSKSLESKQSGQYSYDWSFFNRDYDHGENCD